MRTRNGGYVSQPILGSGKGEMSVVSGVEVRIKNQKMKERRSSRIYTSVTRGTMNHAVNIDE